MMNKQIITIAAMFFVLLSLGQAAIAQSPAVPSGYVDLVNAETGTWKWNLRVNNIEHPVLRERMQTVLKEQRPNVQLVVPPEFRENPKYHTLTVTVDETYLGGEYEVHPQAEVRAKRVARILDIFLPDSKIKDGIHKAERVNDEIRRNLPQDYRNYTRLTVTVEMEQWYYKKDDQGKIVLDQNRQPIKIDAPPKFLEKVYVVCYDRNFDRFRNEQGRVDGRVVFVGDYESKKPIVAPLKEIGPLFRDQVKNGLAETLLRVVLVTKHDQLVFPNPDSKLQGILQALIKQNQTYTSEERFLIHAQALLFYRWTTGQEPPHYFQAFQKRSEPTEQKIAQITTPVETERVPRTSAGRTNQSARIEDRPQVQNPPVTAPKRVPDGKPRIILVK